MAQGNQVGAAAGCLDTRDTGDGDHIAFPVPAGHDEHEGLLRHAHPGLGTRLACCFRLVTDNASFIFCLPASTGACRTGWGRLISHRPDYRTRPCNPVELMPRVLERG